MNSENLGDFLGFLNYLKKFANTVITFSPYYYFLRKVKKLDFALFCEMTKKKFQTNLKTINKVVNFVFKTWLITLLRQYKTNNIDQLFL